MDLLRPSVIILTAQVFGLANKAEKNYVEAIKAFKFSLRLNAVCTGIRHDF